MGKPRNGKAMTLVEMMLALASAGVIAGALYTVSATGERAWFSGSANMALQDELRRAFEALSSGLRASGNEAAIIHLRVDQNAGCPMIVYQIPLAASNYGPVGWGAVIQPGAGQSTWTAQNDAVVWIHRATSASGGGNGCLPTNPSAYRFLVQEVYTGWNSSTWTYDGAQWTNATANPGVIPTGTPVSVRVLSSNLDTSQETGATPIHPFVIQAYQEDGTSATNWPPSNLPADPAWASKVQQVRISLRLRMSPSLGPAVSLEQVAQIQVRNRYKP